MANDFREIIKKVPSFQDHRTIEGNTDEYARVTIEPYISGFYVVEMKLPNILSNTGLLQNDLVDAIPPLKKKVNLINKYTSSSGDNTFAFSRYIVGINKSDDTISVIQNEAHGLNGVFPGSSADDQQLSIIIIDDMDVRAHIIFELWSNLIYYKLLGFSLINGNAYNKENYAVDITLSVYKPNLLDKVKQYNIKGAFPITEPYQLTNQKTSESNHAEYTISFAYSHIFDSDMLPRTSDKKSHDSEWDLGDSDMKSGTGKVSMGRNPNVG